MPVANDDETLPLLGNIGQSGAQDSNVSLGKRLHQIVKKYRLDVWIPIIILSSVLIGIAVIFFHSIIPDIGQYAVEGTDFEAEDINFLGISSSGGVNLELTGTAHNNFTNINDKRARSYFRYGGFVIRRLNMQIDDIDMLVYDSKLDDYNRLGSVHIAPFSVSTVDNSDSKMDLYFTLYPDSKGVLGTVKKLLKDPNTQLKLQGDANVKILFMNGYITLTHVRIPIDLKIPKNLLELPEEQDINMNFISCGKDKEALTTSCSFGVSVAENPFGKLIKVLGLKMINIPGSTWRLLAKGCKKDEKRNTGTLKIDSFLLSEMNSTLTVSSTLDIADSDIQKFSSKCKNEKFSALDKFVEDLRYNDRVVFDLRGKSLPGFSDEVSQAFRKISIPIDIPLNLTEKTANLVKNVTMTDLHFRLQDLQTPIVSGILNVWADLQGLEIDDTGVNALKGNANLKYQGDKFGQIVIGNWRNATTTIFHPETGKTLAFISSELKDMVIDITDSSVFNSLIMQAMQDGQSEIFIDALVDLKMQSPVGNFVIQDIPGSGKAHFSI